MDSYGCSTFVTLNIGGFLIEVRVTKTYPLQGGETISREYEVVSIRPDSPPATGDLCFHLKKCVDEQIRGALHQLRILRELRRWLRTNPDIIDLIKRTREEDRGWR